MALQLKHGGDLRGAKVGEGRRYTKALRMEVTEVVTGHVAGQEGTVRQ